MDDGSIFRGSRSVIRVEKRFLKMLFHHFVASNTARIWTCVCVHPCACDCFELTLKFNTEREKERERVSTTVTDTQLETWEVLVGETERETQKNKGLSLSASVIHVRGYTCEFFWPFDGPELGFDPGSHRCDFCFWSLFMYSIFSLDKLIVDSGFCLL